MDLDIEVYEEQGLRCDRAIYQFSPSVNVDEALEIARHYLGADHVRAAKIVVFREAQDKSLIESILDSLE